MLRSTLTIITVLLLAACGDSSKDYDARASCETMGYQPGQAGFDKCVSQEHTSRMMIEQQKEFEAQQQQIQDYHKKGY